MCSSDLVKKMDMSHVAHLRSRLGLDDLVSEDILETLFKDIKEIICPSQP